MCQHELYTKGTLMSSIHYIGVDVHSNSTELAIEKRGKIVAGYTVPTTVPALANILDSLQGKKHLAMEEGPMAGWLYRNLRNKVDTFVISDPRRNKLIASDGDKDDKIDARKLALLLRGGYLKAVHHTDNNQRVQFKRWISLYHDRVRDAVRNINKIRAQCRMHGVRIPRAVIHNPQKRSQWLFNLKNPDLAAQLHMLWIGYDATARQVKVAKSHLAASAKNYPIIKFWKDLPGVGLIRAATASHAKCSMLCGACGKQTVGSMRS